MRKWIAPLLLLASISAFIRPARAQAPLATSSKEKPASEAYKAENDALPPVLLKIAYCESGNRQFKASGEMVVGDQNPDDWGRFQINRKAHQAEADKLGYDLRTWEGNTAFALWLYEREGTWPWRYSASCWRNKELPALWTQPLNQQNRSFRGLSLLLLVA